MLGPTDCTGGLERGCASILDRRLDGFTLDLGELAILGEACRVNDVIATLEGRLAEEHEALVAPAGARPLAAWAATPAADLGNADSAAGLAGGRSRMVRGRTSRLGQSDRSRSGT